MREPSTNSPRDSPTRLRSKCVCAQCGSLHVCFLFDLAISQSRCLIFSRKEQWGQSVCQVWSVLLTQTRLESREHAALGDTCCNTLTQRLTHSAEDTHRLHKRVSGCLVLGHVLYMQKQTHERHTRLTVKVQYPISRQVLLPMM